ncbi:short-chain dehydrogenase/reductase SDR [Hyaloraphidium curvatum]|nr:short-chain dehydrogenase/reductase SDR [Hyaloraphidium curvatum]
MSAAPAVPPKWTTDCLPSLAGKRAVVTGANSGLGLETALQLARKGAEVWLACRSTDKARAVADEIRAKVPDAKLVTEGTLDLADLASVKAFAATVAKEWKSLDILCNNGGIMHIPNRRLTKDGFEYQFGTNHIGPFALTAHLLPLLMASDSPRVVNIASGYSEWPKAEDMKRIPYFDPYDYFMPYATSKLCNLLFTHELQRRADDAAGGREASKLFCVAAHPGYTATNLQFNGLGNRTVMYYVWGFLNRFVAQSVEMGALPQVFACAAPECPRNSYIGPEWGLPGGPKVSGYPAVNDEQPLAKDAALMKEVFDKSEEWANVKFDFGT